MYRHQKKFLTFLQKNYKLSILNATHRKPILLITVVSVYIAIKVVQVAEPSVIGIVL